MRYIGGAALLVFGAVVWPLFGQLAEPIGVWFGAALCGTCFVAAYELLAPPDAFPFGPGAEEDEATERFIFREKSGS